MSPPREHWLGRRVHRCLFAIWSALGLLLGVAFQFARIHEWDEIRCTLLWLLPAPCIALVAARNAAQEISPYSGLRSLLESIAFTVFTFAGIRPTAAVCKEYGLGRWPPRDGYFAQRLRDQRSEWCSVRDGVLHERKSTGSNLSRDVVNRVDPRQLGVRYHWKDRFGPLGVVDARAARDARWIRLALWQGQLHYDPKLEKGLLYVDPGLSGDPEARLVERIAVTDLGEGWYVYEE